MTKVDSSGSNSSFFSGWFPNIFGNSTSNNGAGSSQSMRRILPNDAPIDPEFILRILQSNAPRSGGASGSHEHHSDVDPVFATHLLSEFMEDVAHIHFSPPMAPPLPRAIEKLPSPITINDQICTHRMGPIFGSKNGVTHLVAEMKKIYDHSPELYRFIITQLENGRAAIVAIETSDVLRSVNTGGGWGPFTELDPHSRFQVGIQIDVTAFNNVPGRSIAGSAGHEWMHEYSDLKAIEKGALPFLGNPCTTLEEAEALTKVWLEEYNAFGKTQSNPINPNGSTAAEFFFGHTSREYRNFVNAESKVVLLANEIKATTDPAKIAQLQQRFQHAMKELRIAKNTFLTEISSYLFETKINHGEGAIRAIAVKTAKQLDHLYGEPIFLQKNYKKVAKAFFRIGGRALNFTALALDIAEGILCTPRKEGSFADYVARGTLFGCSKFVLQTLLAPLYIASTLESLAHEPEEGHGKSDVPNRGTPFIALGGGMCAFKGSYQYALSRPGESTSLRNILTGVENIFGKAVVCLLYDNTLLANLLKGMDRYFLAPHIVDDPEVFIPVTRGLVDQIGSAMYHLPEDFSSWSQEKQAKWYQDNIIKPAEQLMPSLIEKAEKRKRDTEQKNEELKAKFPELFQFDLYPSFHPLNRGNAAARMFNYLGFNNLPYHQMSPEMLKIVAPALFGALCAAERPPQIPSAWPSDIPHLFAPKDQIVQIRSPDGGIRICPPNGGIFIDFIGGSSSGVLIALGIDLLKGQEVFTTSKQICGVIAKLFSEAPSLAAGLGIPLIFAVATGMGAQRHYARASAKDRALDIEDRCRADEIDVNNLCKNVISPILEHPPGELTTEEVEQLNNADARFGEEIEIVKNEKNRINNDSNLPWEEKVEAMNRLNSIENNYLIRQQAIQHRVDLENFYKAHENDSPDQLVALIKDPSLTEIQRTVALDLLLPQINSESLSTEEKLTWIRDLQTSCPQYTFLNRLEYNLLQGQKVETALSALSSVLQKLDFKSIPEAMHSFFKTLFPTDLPFTPAKTPKPNRIPLIGVPIGLQEESPNTVNDITSENYFASPGLNKLISTFNGQSFSDMDPAFIERTIQHFTKKGEKWEEREDNGELSWETGRLVQVGCANSISDLQQLQKDKQFYDLVQANIGNFDFLISLVPNAEGDTQNQIIQSALEQSLAQDMQSGSPAFPAHLNAYLENYENPILQEIASNQEQQNRFSTLLENYGEIHSAEEVQAFFAALGQSFPELEPFCTQQQKILEKRVFFDFAKKTLEVSKEVLGLLFKTLGNDFIQNPTKIPFLRQYREEDFANNETIAVAQKLVKAFQAVHNFDPSILPGIFLSLRYQADVHREVLDELVWNNPDFRPNAIIDLFKNGNWETKRSLGSLLRLGDVLLFLAESNGLQHPLLDTAKTGIEIAKLFNIAELIEFQTQVVPHLLNAFEAAYTEHTNGRNFDSSEYQFVKNVSTPFLLFVSGWIHSQPLVIVSAGFFAAYKGLTSLDNTNQAKLANLQLAINESRLKEAQDRLWALEKENLRADDRDRLGELQVEFYYAMAQKYARNLKAIEQRKKVYTTLLESVSPQTEAETRSHDKLKEELSSLQRQKEDNLKHRNFYNEFVIGTTDKWLQYRPTEETSTKFPSLKTMMLRGMVLLSRHEEYKALVSEDEENSLPDTFENLLLHYRHRGVVPHQLLKAYHYPIAPHSFAVACHHQMSINGDHHQSTPPNAEEVLQLSSVMGAGMRRLGYRRREGMDSLVETQSSSSGPIVHLPPDTPKEKKTFLEMKRLAPDLHEPEDPLHGKTPNLYRRTLAYLRGQSTLSRFRADVSYSRILRTKESQQTFINESENSLNGETPNLFQSALNYFWSFWDPSASSTNLDISRAKDHEQTFIKGWILFLEEMFDAHEDKVNIRRYQRLDECIKCGFNPPVTYLMQAMLPKEKRSPFIEMLNRFDFDKLPIHQRILIFFELSNPKIQKNIVNLDVKIICNKIRRVIGSAKLDRELSNILPYAYDQTETHKNEKIASLLRQGASPDQVFDWKQRKNADYAVGQSKPFRYFLHRLAERERVDLIELFANYGANFQQGNFYDMNALEHLLAVSGMGYHGWYMKETMQALIKGGIDPSRSSGSFSSSYNGFEGANPIVAAANHAFTTFGYHSPVWYLGMFDSSATSSPNMDATLDNLQYFCGMSAKQIAKYKRISLPN